MKIKHIWLALMPLWMASCSTEENNIPMENQQEVRVTAGIGAQSRIAMSDGGSYTQTFWQDGDRISLFTDTQSNLVYSTSNEGGSLVADFLPVDEGVQDVEGDTVYACYPETTQTSAEGVVVSLPSTATVDYLNGALPAFSYAVSTIQKGSLIFAFQHLSAFLCLKADENLTGINQVTVTTTSTEPLSIGEGDTFDFATLTANLTNGSNKVVVNVDSEMANGTKDIFIPILPQPADAVITLTVTDSAGNTLYTQTKQAPETGFLAENVYKIKTTREEREQLLAFYESAYGDSWTDNTNWGSDKPLGEWYGITTDENGWVTAIDLSDNNLTGWTEIDLGCFTKLESINLDKNAMVELYIIGSAKMDSLVLNNPTSNSIRFENFQYVEINCDSLTSLWGSCKSLKVSNCDFKDHHTPFSGVEVTDAVIYNCKMHSCGIISDTLTFESSSTYDTWHCYTNKRLSIINSHCSTICGDFNSDTVIVLENATLWRSNWDEESTVTLTVTTTGAGWYDLF